MSIHVTIINGNIDYMKTSIGNRIRDKRKELRLTQNEIAKALGVSRVSVTKWENGDTKPDGENLHILTKVLACNIEWLLYGKDLRSEDDTKLYRLSSATFKRIPLLTGEQISKWDGITPFAEISDLTVWSEVMSDVSANAFMMLVKGDSMANPHGSPSIPDGSKILVDPNYGDFDDLNGKIIVIQLENSKEPTIKKLSIDGPNKYLIPLNPSFKIIELEGNYTIKGRVTKIIQELQ
ncbi:MAG: helix-turn-helix domain-containing protein [Candidatus Arsenophonus phytopathogenicus]